MSATKPVILALATALLGAGPALAWTDQDDVEYSGNPVCSYASPCPGHTVPPYPVGTPGRYDGYGNGYSVQVYLGGNGTGYQPFRWQTDGRRTMRYKYHDNW